MSTVCYQLLRSIKQIRSLIHTFKDQLLSVKQGRRKEYREKENHAQGN